MPRLSLSWPFVHLTHPTLNNNIPADNDKANRRRRNGTRTRKAPRVTPRESSLYRNSSYSRSSARSVSATTHAPPAADPASTQSSTLPSTSLYHLEENPSLFFPSPPPRLDLSFDTKRHSVVWDEFFDWAEGIYDDDDASDESPLYWIGCQSQVDLRASRRSVRFEEGVNHLGLKGLQGRGVKSEIWSTSYLSTMSTAPPIVPPRSRLRANIPPPLTPQSSYLLPVDTPLGDATPPYTPGLSACRSSEQGSPPIMPVSPETETVVFGRRKVSPAGSSKDPLRIRDGTQPRRSSSGVYTPPTFPGAQGPRPSHFPSHVYTPPSFLLHPTQPTPSNYAYSPPGGPSRSASVSSQDSDSPATPGSSTSRFSTFSGKAGKAMNGLKRISHQIQSNVTPPAIKQPISARESYFPSSIGSGVQRVYDAPSTRPVSRAPSYGASSGHGLGVGLAENEGRTSTPTTPTAATFSPRDSEGSGRGTVIFDGGESAGETGSVNKASTSPAAKGKRKPVPKMLDDTLAGKVDELRIDDAPATHAL